MLSTQPPSSLSYAWVWHSPMFEKRYRNFANLSYTYLFGKPIFSRKFSSFVKSPTLNFIFHPLPRFLLKPLSKVKWAEERGGGKRDEYEWKKAERRRDVSAVCLRRRRKRSTEWKLMWQICSQRGRGKTSCAHNTRSNPLRGGKGRCRRGIRRRFKMDIHGIVLFEENLGNL